MTQHYEEFSPACWTELDHHNERGHGAEHSFGHMARRHGLLICTAELLQKALASLEEEEHVELSGEGCGQERAARGTLPEDPKAPVVVKVL